MQFITLAFPISGNSLRWPWFVYFAVFFSLSLADFHPITVKDHVMVKQVYRVLKTKDWMSCVLECNGDSQCSSYNFEVEADSCPGHICELSKCAMNEKREKGLIAKRGFVFQQLKPSQNKDLCKKKKKKKKKKNKDQPIKSYNGLELSAILKRDPKYAPKLLEFLGQKTQNRTWTRCYHSNHSGFDAKVFHKKCDNKASTVTIIRVGNFTFGGYIDVPWQSTPEKPITSKEAFLFSLYNANGSSPHKFSVKQDDDPVAVKHDPDSLIFGDNDLVIAKSSEKSYFSPSSYEVPPSCKVGGEFCTFYTNTTNFYPTDVEVFHI